MPPADPKARTRTLASVMEDPAATLSHADATDNGHAINASASSSRRPAPLQVRDPERYDLMGEHGRGGLGRIIRARDRELGRSLAIKELLTRTPSSELRFFREALITARLEHPGIVPVHEAGRWPDGTPFYAMKLVAGRPLKDLIQSARNDDERLALLPHVTAVADAVAYAHANGIIHRDLKPSNVMVGDFGETVVIDWGLAKHLSWTDSNPPDSNASSAGELTQVGAVLGTPAYMPPEQAQGGHVDERADVYAIGAMLRDIFPSTSKACSRDLAAIISRSLSPMPAERYRTAAELSQDLRRLQSGSMVAARTYAWHDSVWRLVLRHKTAFTIGALALIFVLGITAVSLSRIAAERNVAIERSKRLQESSRQLQAERDARTLALASSEAVLDPTQALHTLASYSGLDKLSATEVGLQAIERGAASFVLKAPPFNILQASRTSRGLVLSTSERTLSIFEAGQRTPIAEHLAEYGMFETTPDGRTHLWIDSSNWLRLTSDSQQTRILPLGYPGAMMSLSDDGTVFTAVDRERKLHLCRVRGTAVCSLVDGVALAMVSSSGDFLLTCSNDGRGDILSIATMRALSTWDCPTNFFSSVRRMQGGEDFIVAQDGGQLVHVRPGGVTRLRPAFADSIRFVATAGASVGAIDVRGNIKAWDLASTADSTYSGTADGIGSRNSTTSLAISNDGRLIGLGKESGAVEVHDLTDRTHRTLLGHQRAPHALQFAPDGTLDSASVDSLRSWDVTDNVSAAVLTLNDALFHVDFYDNGSLVAETRSGHLHLARGTRQAVDLGSGGGYGLAVAGESGPFAVAGRDGSIPVISNSGVELARLRGHKGLVRDIKFNSNGRLLSCGADGTVRHWNIERGSSAVLVAHEDECYRIAISNSGNVIAAATYDGYVVLHFMATGRTEKIRASQTRVNAISFEGEEVLAATNDRGLVRASASSNFSELKRGTSASLLLHAESAGTISAWHDGAVYVKCKSCSVHTQVVAPRNVVPRALESSGNGRYLAVSYANGSIRVVRVDDMAIASVTGHTDIVSGLAFSSDSRLLATAGQDGRLLLTPLDELVFYGGAANTFRPATVVTL